MNKHLKILILCLSVFMSACTIPVKKIEYGAPLNMPEDAHPSPIKFSGVDLLLPPGMDLGYEKIGRVFCSVPRVPVNRNLLHKAIDRKFLRQNFNDAMAANGYNPVGGLDVSFDLDEEEQRAEYSIKGKIKDAHLDMCTKISDPTTLALTLRPGTKGEMYLAIDWSIYDLLRRKVVYKTRTEGYTKRKYPNQEGMTLMFHDAFEMAVHNLATNEDFYNLMVKGETPPPSAKQTRKEERFQNRARLFDPQEKVSVPRLPLSRAPFGQHAEKSRKAAVAIWKGGHGSGFFISDQGHILTNAHVVGEGMRTRLITADRKHKLIAEVLRVNKARDVALLKLESIPEGLDIVTLPLRLDWPNVSEDVYAIGAPQNYTLQDTVTKGIVSAHRRDKKIRGLRADFIQADVDIHGGSSGGPLLDEYGNIVGISVIGMYPSDGQRGIGLNLFIPIEEALRALDIEI